MSILPKSDLNYFSVMLMFFFYAGRKKAKLGNMQSPNEPCPSCQMTGSLFFKFYRKHIHLYFLPLFPYKNVASVTCVQCGFHQDPIKKSSGSLYQEFKFFLPEFKKPLWQWTGSFVFPALIGLFIWLGVSLNKKEELAILNPQVNYVLSYKTEDGLYSTYKIVQVSMDSVWVSPNKYYSESRKGNRKYKRANDYNTDTLVFEKKEIVRLYQSEIIYGVETNSN